MKQNEKNKSENHLKIIPVGGLNEIGKNMTVLEYQNQIMIIDCGVSFPDDEMFGIDVVIPDFTYLKKNKKKIKGVILTHGHEDHIGAIPYLLQEVNIPIYGTRLTLGLVKNKLEEFELTGKFNTIKHGDKIKMGPFHVEVIRTTHSIPDAVCFCIDTPAGRIFHTGDFKIDYTPVDGAPINLSKLASIGAKGVDLLMCDSTNAVRPGFTQSEKHVGQALESIFKDSKDRIIVATFSSNVHRIQKIIDIAISYGRKVAVSGRSMVNVVDLAKELGYIKAPAGTFVDINKTKNIPDDKIVIITTGSQGEPMSALSRMASREHKSIHIKKGDMVILSSTPVPGNEKTVSNVVNKLFQCGAQVIYSDIAETHVSGHACQEELKIIHSLIKPKYFMPVHGEFRHLISHKDIAVNLGMDERDIFILENGQCLNVSRRKIFKDNMTVPADDVMVDGLGIGDVGSVVLRDRRILSESGLIIAFAAIDSATRQIVSGPDIISRGFVYVRENESLIKRAKHVAEEALDRCSKKNISDWNQMKNAVRDDLGKFIYQETERRPIILTLFLEV